MSSPATVTRQIFDGYEAQAYTAPELSAAGAIKPIFWRQLFPLTVAGTYSIPNLRKGQVVLLDVQATVNITNAAGTAIATFYSGEVVELTAKSDSGSFTYRRLTSETPNAKYVTSAATTTATPAAADWSGARHVYWENTADGALGVTAPALATIISGLSGIIYDGYSWLLTIVNRGNNTATITASEYDVGGELTIATLTTRTYVMRYFNGALFMTSVNKGTIET